MKELPTGDIFECEIKTKQFEGSQEKFHYHKQKGRFDKKTLLFTPFNRINGDHKVQFRDMATFK